MTVQEYVPQEYEGNRGMINNSTLGPYVAVDLQKHGFVMLREKPKQSYSCWKWIGVFSFTVVLLASAFLTLMYFDIIPSLKASPETKLQVEGTLPVNITPEENNTLPEALKQMAIKPQTPAAHLVADVSSDLKWLSDVDQAFLENGMKLEDGVELIIPRNGLYFIYVQAVFETNQVKELTGSGDCVQSTDLSISVQRYSESYPVYVSILSTSRSLCLPKMKDSFHLPLYQGALFKLLKGDKLKVLIDPLEFVDDRKTFFGAFAL
ncbi:tumor necrosis factor-like isoform X1 [Polypterus senegalus]|uniref:tumor necrosis factor-like isoform X1 n=1 Tax=Polypterus senegalus TaxID=55291 RepID=UPI0019628E74|nr:tumor necrosis factor-like isoform X1 [Polypterus senegalus]